MFYQVDIILLISEYNGKAIYIMSWWKSIITKCKSSKYPEPVVYLITFGIKVIVRKIWHKEFAYLILLHSMHHTFSAAHDLAKHSMDESLQLSSRPIF